MAIKIGATLFAMILGATSLPALGEDAVSDHEALWAEHKERLAKDRSELNQDAEAASPQAEAGAARAADASSKRDAEAAEN